MLVHEENLTLEGVNSQLTLHASRSRLLTFMCGTRPSEVNNNRTTHGQTIRKVGCTILQF